MAGERRAAGKEELAQAVLLVPLVPTLSPRFGTLSGAFSEVLLKITVSCLFFPPF